MRVEPFIEPLCSFSEFLAVRREFPILFFSAVDPQSRKIERNETGTRQEDKRASAQLWEIIVNPNAGKSTEDCRIKEPKKRPYALSTYHWLL